MLCSILKHKLGAWDANKKTPKQGQGLGGFILALEFGLWVWEMNSRAHDC